MVTIVAWILSPHRKICNLGNNCLCKFRSDITKHFFWWYCIDQCCQTHSSFVTCGEWRLAIIFFFEIDIIDIFKYMYAWKNVVNDPLHLPQVWKTWIYCNNADTDKCFSTDVGYCGISFSKCDANLILK